MSFSFKESDLKNLIGTSNLQQTLKEMVSEMKTMKAQLSEEIGQRFEEADARIEARMQEAERAAEKMKDEVMENAQKQLALEIDKVNAFVGDKLGAVVLLQESVDTLQQSQNELTANMTTMQNSFAKTEASLQEAMILVDGACSQARASQQKLDAALKEQAGDKASITARVTAAMDAARAAESKSDDTQESLMEALEELSQVNTDLPELKATMSKVAETSESNFLANQRLTSTLSELKEKVDSEFSGIADTLDAARVMQSSLSTEMIRLQESAQNAETGLVKIRAEQHVGLKKLTDRMDRNDGMLKLKANQNDLVRLLGSKADRDVIDVLANERMKFLREVNSKMNDVENQVCDKADLSDVRGFAKEQEVVGMLKQQAADLTTFVSATIEDEIEKEGHARVADCAQLQARIEEVTGEVVTLTTAEAEKVDARLAALRNQMTKKADTSALKRMDDKIKKVAVAGTTKIQETSDDAAALFFRCLSCDTKLPKLRGQQALQTLGGMLPAQPIAPAMENFLEKAQTDEALKAFLTTESAEEIRPQTNHTSPLDLQKPMSPAGKRLLLTGSDGRLYKGSLDDGSQNIPPPLRNKSPAKRSGM